MKSLAIKAVKEAGKILLDGFNKKHIIKSKTPHDFVTEIDVKAEKKVMSILKKSGYSFLAEESGVHGNNDYRWIIDPLDGTNNYVMKNPIFNTALALMHKDKIILSAIYVPVTKDLFYAEHGKGAFLNGKKIRVSSRDKLINSFVLYGHSNKIEDIKIANKIHDFFKLKTVTTREYGAASNQFTSVAAGWTDAFIVPGAPLWDMAPGILMVREAGGIVTDFKGKKWNLSSKTMVASNGKIHKEILNILKKI